MHSHFGAVIVKVKLCVVIGQNCHQVEVEIIAISVLHVSCSRFQDNN